ncbi:MAG: prolyl aminopeptidase [Methylobacter sp.]|nr:MAG: prolyl aminopeptidase [Methylobacter sp.]
MKTLYPEIEPFQTFFLETQSEHKIYVEQSGNPEGIPVVFLHGGPCSGTKPDHRRFFNPDRYRIILFDQRGCGQSLPFGELEANTTQDLLADMERIRKQLQLPQWLLFGGSWGATLALLYAQNYPGLVLGMILRGVFLARQQDMDWYIHYGANLIYPEQWQVLRESVTESQRKDFLPALWSGISGCDEVAQRRIAKAWAAWGGQVALGNTYQPSETEAHVTEQMVKQVRMELHYAKHQYFIAENQILRDCTQLQAIPAVIIHGRRDLVCPVEAGVKLHNALPKAEFIILPDAGHIAHGETMIDALVTATEAMAAAISAKAV